MNYVPIFWFFSVAIFPKFKILQNLRLDPIGLTFCFLMIVTSPFALQAAQQTTSQSSADELQGRYFLYFSGDELLNISAARLELGAETGVITLTNGSAYFNWHVDQDGVIQLSLLEPILTGRGFISVPGYSSSRVKEIYITKIALKPLPQPDNSLRFDYEAEQSVQYPDSHLPEEISSYRHTFNAVKATEQIAMRELLPLDKWFLLPFDLQKNVNVLQSNFSVTERAQRVKLTSKQENTATGIWQSLEPTDQRLDNHATEEISVVFEADGSATFNSVSGKTANVMAFRRFADNELIVNVIYSDLELQPPAQKLAVSNTLNIKNPLFNRSAPGIYAFKQNGTPNNTFWLQLNSDGTGETVEIYDVNQDGIVTGDEVVITPHLWQYVIDNNALKVEMRRYYYKRGSGADGVCIPETFAPAPTESCVLERSRIIEFFDSGTLDGKPIVYTENKFVFYSTHFFNDATNHVHGSISVDNRYYYTSDEPPIVLPALVQNDNLQSAKVMLGNAGTFDGNTTAATRQSGEPCHLEACNTVSVWYSFTPAEDGELSLELTAANLSNLKLSVYNGTSFTTMSVVGDLQLASDNIKWSAALKKGWQIRIAVSHDPASTSGESFQLSWLHKEIVKTPISSITFADPALQSCAANTAKTYAEDVEWLNCYGVKDLSGIEYFSRLRTLSLVGVPWLGNLTDLRPLLKLNLDYLNTLDLQNNNLTSVQFNILKDLKPSKLLSLQLNSNRLDASSLQVINHLVSDSVVSLNISHNLLSSLVGLENNLEQLISLNIGFNPITDLASVRSIINKSLKLSELRIQGLGLTTDNGFVWPVRLNLLDLSFNPLKEIGVTVNSTNLPESLSLILSNTDLEQAAGLKNMQLFSLDLSNTKISDASFLTKLKSVQSVGLANTYIETLTYFSNVNNLTSLNVSNNNQLQCEDISNFRSANPAVSLLAPNVCSTSRYTANLATFYNADVVGVQVKSVFGADAADFGTISWQDGVLTFTPKPGFQGRIHIVLYVYTAQGTYTLDYRFNLQPARNKAKKRKLPVWLFLD